MNNYPEYVKINNKKYKINTDFRYIIKCNKVSMDETIGDYERGLAFIYILYGDEGLKDKNNYSKLVELGIKFIKCGEEKENKDIIEEFDMDFIEDWDYIEASFMSDYHIDLSTTKMHWWRFNKLINGLSNSEMGNCCILNKIRNIRNINLKEIKDQKERKRMAKLKQQFALKNKHKKLFTEEEKSNIAEFMKLAGIDRK